MVKTNLDALAQTLTSAGQQPDAVEVQRLSARLGTLNDKLVNETEQKVPVITIATVIVLLSKKSQLTS